MKSKLLLLAMFSILSVAMVKADDPDFKQGLGSQLAFWKNLSEAKLATILTSEKDADTKAKSVAKYVHVKAAIDKLIFQLELDMVSKNCASPYKKLDKYLKHNKTGKTDDTYSNIITEIDTRFKALMSANVDVNGKAFTGAPLDIVSAVFDGIEKIAGIVNAAAERRAAKVEGLNAILDTLKLVSPADLNPKEKEDAKKPKP